jgi:lysophospholipid acyltransferase (LPLAT)-like uncharacterized protein
VDAARNRGSFAERALTSVVGWMIRILGMTLRFRREGEAELLETLRANSPVIVFGWHEFLTLGCCDLAHYGPTIMISQSRDGDRVTRIAESVGWHVVRGSSSRGGARALLQVVRVLEAGGFACHLVDGPRGPRHELKPGLLMMAQRSGATLFPTAYAASWSWRPNSWDRQLVPLPFSRVAVRYLPPRCVAPNLDAESVELLRVELERELVETGADLEALLANQPASLSSRSERE